jgi:hypothetical protein
MGYKIQVRLFSTMIAIWAAVEPKKICTLMKLVHNFLDDQILYSQKIG